MNADKPKIRVDALTIMFRESFKKGRRGRGPNKRLLLKELLRRRPATKFVALDGVSFSVSEGDIVGVIGPNGCGKTTLLRTICGIYHPDCGHVERHGRISTLLSLGTGFDNRLNGIDNITLSGLIMGLTPSEIEEHIPAIVDFADIGDHIYQPLRHYSSGMISRISFAIAVALRPDILLLDEVFSVGDLAFQRKSERAMHELLSRASCQLIVSHNLDFVVRHCNRAIYLRNGKLIADGDPQEVVDRYKRDS